jgi:methionyl-tRNA formyltransferase
MMQIVFAGTPEFAAVALAAILDVAEGSAWRVPLVLTQPDRPAGRGLKLVASPVKQLAAARGIEVLAPPSLRKGEEAAATKERLRAFAPDVLVVAAYGLILPPDVLEIPRGLQARNGNVSAINIHASLLPRWRGAAPIARAIEAGDAETGITIMQMDAGLDTGPMLISESMPIEADDTTASLTVKLAALGARLIVNALRDIDRLLATPQPASGANYAPKIDKAEGWLDWSASAALLERKIRAYDPFPGAAAMFGEIPLKLWRARTNADSNAAAPGTVLAANAGGIHVACGEGELVITELQRAGGKRLPAREFLAGTPIHAGDRLTRPFAVQ